MTAVRRVLAWLARHWYVPLVAVVGVLAFLAGRRAPTGRRQTPLTEVRKELRAIRAGAEAEIAAAERGTEEAVHGIEERKADALRALDERQAEKARRLRDDPRALARYLERVGGG